MLESCSCQCSEGPSWRYCRYSRDSSVNRMGVVVGPHYSDNAVATDTVMAPVVVSSYLLLNSCVDCWHASQSTGLSLCTILDLSCRADIHTLVLCHLIKYFVTCLLPITGLCCQGSNCNGYRRMKMSKQHAMSVSSVVLGAANRFQQIRGHISVLGHRPFCQHH